MSRVSGKRQLECQQPKSTDHRLDSVQSEPKEVEKFFAEGLLNKTTEVQYEDQHSLEAK